MACSALTSAGVKLGQVPTSAPSGKDKLLASRRKTKPSVTGNVGPVELELDETEELDSALLEVELTAAALELDEAILELDDEVALDGADELVELNIAAELEVELAINELELVAVEELELAASEEELLTELIDDCVLLTAVAPPVLPEPPLSQLASTRAAKSTVATLIGLERQINAVSCITKHLG